MMARILMHPYAFVAALVLLGIVLGVSCWPRVQPATVVPTAPPPLPSPTVYVFWPSVTPTPPDVFTVPPTRPEVPLSTPLPTATVTPTVTPTLIPPPATATPEKPAVQRG